jgi:hypothetical protein
MAVTIKTEPNNINKITLEHTDKQYTLDIYESKNIGTIYYTLSDGTIHESGIFIKIVKDRNELFDKEITDSFGRKWIQTEKYNEFVLN